MVDHCQKTQNSISNQAVVFRIAERDHGLSIAVLAAATGIPAATLRGWRDGSVMPAWALFKLGKEGGIPEGLLSFLAEPFGLAVAPAESERERIAADAAALSEIAGRMAIRVRVA